INLGALEHKSAAYMVINPLQRVPAAICRYFEALHPQPPLFGRDGREAALIEMWNRRLELNLYEAVSAVFRHLHPAMREMEQQVPQWGEANKPRVKDFLPLVHRELADP